MGSPSPLDNLSEPTLASSPQPDPSSALQAGLGAVHFVTQDDCFKHVFRRQKHSAGIFERPERLRFVNLGFAAALAWDLLSVPSKPPARLLSPPSIIPPLHPQSLPPIPLVHSSRAIFTKTTRAASPDDCAISLIHDEQNNPPSPPASATPPPGASSVKDAHPDLLASSSAAVTADRTPASYLDQLIGLCLKAAELNHLGLSEVPEHLPQGDLYLSTGSGLAILGAIGACYAAIDSVLRPENLTSESDAGLSSTKCESEVQWRLSKRAFVNVRPPGHHCTNSEPMGFCWVNNVLISCMYSHLFYGIDRICIVDIDLHHGNGSQEIVWKINSEANEDSDTSLSSAVESLPHLSGVERRKLKISYSSLHDINSYPCEDGDPDRIKDASVNLCAGNSINQFIQNLHLEDWSDEADFYQRLYPKTWSAFEEHMTKFFEITGARSNRSLIFVSAGFDACEHESDSMSRYSKKLPTSFFHRFARDIGRFSDTHCEGRLISVLEGGYSQHTLTGSSLSYMLGLMDRAMPQTDPGQAPWSLARINRLLSLCKKPGPSRVVRSVSANKIQTQSLGEADTKDLEWLAETGRIFQHIDAYDQVKSELGKLAKQEEKQIKMQHSLRRLSLVADNSSAGGPFRRSQRHASGSGQPSSAEQASQRTTSLQAYPSDRKEVSTRASPQRRAEKGDQNGSAPSISGDVSQATCEGDQLIDNLFDNLTLEDPSSARLDGSLPPDKPDGSSSERRPDDTVPIAGLTSPEKALPKLKFVWKAGGMFGTKDASTVTAEPVSHPARSQTAHSDGESVSPLTDEPSDEGRPTPNGAI